MRGVQASLQGRRNFFRQQKLEQLTTEHDEAAAQGCLERDDHDTKQMEMEAKEIGDELALEEVLTIVLPPEFANTASTQADATAVSPVDGSQPPPPELAAVIRPPARSLQNQIRR